MDKKQEIQDEVQLIQDLLMELTMVILTTLERPLINTHLNI